MSEPTSLPEPVDYLAFGPHPDDVELCAGGLMLLAKARGQRVVVVDMTSGESGSRGTAAGRAQEADAAAEQMGVVARETLGLPDTRVEVNPDAISKVGAMIRRWRPRVIVGPCLQDRHPDHIACAELIRRAYYGATLARGPGQPLPPHRPDVWMQYFGHLEPTPSFIVDISDVWEARIELARCYMSQVSETKPGEPETNIGQPDFLRRMEARCAYWGSRIGAQYGEPYLVDRLLPVDDPVATFVKRGGAVL